MIKLTFCLTRLPHLSRQAFQAYMGRGYVAADFAPTQEGGRRRVHGIGVADLHAGRDAMRVPSRPPFGVIGFVDTRIPSS